MHRTVCTLVGCSLLTKNQQLLPGIMNDLIEDYRSKRHWFCDDQQIQNKIKSKFSWLAPEILFDKGVSSPQSDVYSLCVLIKKVT